MEDIMWMVALVVALLVGGGLGSTLFSSTTVLEVPVIITETVEVEKVVEVEVPVEDNTLQDAVDEFMEAVKNEEDDAGNDLKLLRCSGDNYDFDEISVSKIYDEWSVTYDDDKTTVDFEIKLKYKETDERSCRNTFDVTVMYEDDEDTEVKVY